ncbi:TetR/AcrR family transcriptional regulator [Pseudaminobacter sp. 19-2017]|uniref:TetR/AcrR family transcriptional regulator n=1 Tax=Pseudaminobacter soli (ex Zhang et al. 2022) TaxID=2831468 RepID=A0A942I2X8_9HYPH|nr:TetR/AcrR family transcriptional regulator [Pseudaminobacter soli]
MATGRPKKRYHHGGLREALIEAAEQELAEKGIEGFTLRGVAKRAGVSHAAPAHHFRDTGELLTALAAVGAQRFLSGMTEREAAAGDDPRGRFVATGRAYIEFALANPALFELMFGSKRPDFDEPIYTTPASQSFRVLVDGIAALRGDDPLTSREGRAAVMSAWSLVHGFASLVIAGRVRFIREDFEADPTGTIERLIAPVVPRPEEKR